MKSLNQEYKELQNGVFTLNTVQNMVQTLSVNQLVELGLASFIGSISSPRNENLSTYFFDLAKHKSETKREELLVEYYTAYVQKMLAAEKGDKEMFDLSNRKILSLVTEENEEHVPGVIYHSLAKEMYKVALNTMGTKNKRSKEGLFRQAASLFEIAAQHGHTPAYYYLAELYESGDMPGGLNFVKATEFYKAAAAGDFPKALFKLSLMYSYAHQGFQRAQHAKESPPAVHLCQESG
jgi:TPR repeat protein